MSTQFDYSILIHYSEIALKKNNRKFFEKIFINNIQSHLSGLKYSSIKLYEARVFIHNVNINHWEKFKKRLFNVMGLKNFVLMIKTTSDINAINKASLHLVENKQFNSFRITSKRIYKNL